MPPTARPFSAGLVRTVDTSRTRIIAVTLCIVAIAIAARAYGIGSQSLWTDELFSRFYPDLFSLRYLWTIGLLHESSPPLYYMAIEGWMRLFGTSAVAMRSLSLVASVLTLPLIYLIAIELFDWRRGLAAMLIFALLPLQVSFAQDARTYTLLLIPTLRGAAGNRAFPARRHSLAHAGALWNWRHHRAVPVTRPPHSSSLPATLSSS